ncbi:MAG TPA: MarR family winged helix-turn-helix transcriptional regulator [Pyrinomonadaceae bacterium]|nr:MarR family winged helix-turn-helix transcriptional regulator [Pyrinomonadaceae bacterium]
MEIESTVSFLLSKLGVAHRNLVERSAVGIGLHSGQIFVLMELWKRDGQRQIDLATNLGLAAPTVNKILGGLIEGDFVTRGKYEDDARSTRVFLTPKGINVKKEVEAQWERLEAETTASLTDTEVLMAKQLLEKMLSAPSEDS